MFPDFSESYTKKEQNTNNQSAYTSLLTTARDPSTTYCKSQNITYVQPNNIWLLSTYLSKSERWLQSQPGSPNVTGLFIDVNPSIWWCTVVINKEIQNLRFIISVTDSLRLNKLCGPDGIKEFMG